MKNSTLRILLILSLACWAYSNYSEKSDFLSNVNSSEIFEKGNKNKSILNSVKNITNTSVSFNMWDDIAALGLWFIILLIFGPTAAIAVIVFICCKNIIFRHNPSPLLG